MSELYLHLFFKLFEPSLNVSFTSHIVFFLKEHLFLIRTWLLGDVGDHLLSGSLFILVIFKFHIVDSIEELLELVLDWGRFGPWTKDFKQSAVINKIESSEILSFSF